MNEEVSDEFIIKRIKCLSNKKNKNMTYYRISKNSGMNPSTLNNILTGKFKDPRYSTIVSICKELNISIKDFFNSDIFN